MPNPTTNKFPGFPSTLEKSTWQFPSVINGYVHVLNGAEFKVLWYILRHTYGWQKSSDRLSQSQISKGIRKRDGTILDRGTGLSVRWIRQALHSLEEKGFISIQRTIGKVTEISPRIETAEESSSPLRKKVTGVGEEESSPTITNVPITNTNNSIVEFNSFLEEFNTLFSTAYRFTNGRLEKFRVRLKTYTSEQIMIALHNLTQSDWHKGKNDRGWVANPDFLLRNDEQIDTWLNYKPKPKTQFMHELLGTKVIKSTNPRPVFRLNQQPEP